MRLALFFILVSVTIVVVHCASEKQDKAWEDFKVQFNKHYSSRCEEKRRKRIFLYNKCKIDKINREYEKGLITYSARIYSWADLTDEEFKKQKLGLEPPTDDPTELQAESTR